MQLNFWLLPDISFYTSLQNYPPSHTRGPWRLQHFPPYLSRKILTEMRCELCARACLTDSKFASHFWLLEGVWKTTGRWDASYNESQCVNEQFFNTNYSHFKEKMSSNHLKASRQHGSDKADDVFKKTVGTIREEAYITLTTLLVFLDIQCRKVQADMG